MPETDYSLTPIGVLHSPLKQRDQAPNQGHEGAPDAWLEVSADFAEGLDGIQAGQEIILMSWLRLSHRDSSGIRWRT